MRPLFRDDVSRVQGRRRSLPRLALTWLLSLYFGAAPAQEAVTVGSGFDELIVELNLNGTSVGEGVLVLRNRTGEWFLPSDVLADAKVLSADVPAVRFNETSYVPLELLGTQASSFDEGRMALAIHLPPSRFRPTSLGTGSTGDITLPGQSAGAFLNYDLLLDHVAGHGGRSLYTEAGGAMVQGVGVISALAIDRVGLRHSVRLDTTFTRDLPERMATLHVGDGITHASTILGRPVRFGGVQWGTNFQTRPGLVTVPVATLSGQAALPSTVDLYVNDVFQTRSTVTPGPFSIISTPLVSGEGEVVLKITDIAGQQQIVTQRFYASSVLLAQGLTDYSVELGALRRNYGLRSNDYGDLFVAGSWRHGISNRLTAEAAVNAQQGGGVGVEVGASAAFTQIGTAAAALGLSHAEGGPGAQIAMGFERRTNTHSISLRTQFASEHFRQTGVDANQMLRRLISLFYGYRIEGLGNIGFSYTRQQRAGAEPVAIATASLTPRQTRWGNFTLSLVQSHAERNDTSINVFWSMNTDRATTMSAFVTQPSDGPSQSVFQVQSNQPPGEGWGYRLQAASNAANQASVFGQNAFGSGRLDVAELHGQASVRAGISGGFALLDGQMFVTRRIDGSFGVVRVPGFDNVRIYVDNQLAGRTNADGYALLPRLHPYLKNNVSIEQLDLPLDARLEQLRVHPVPAWRSGIVIDFPIRHAAAATMDLLMDDGTPVPAGSGVTLAVDDALGGETFVVGDEGLLYVSGLRSQNTLRASWAQGRCEARVRYLPEKGMVPHLGRQICERQGGRK